MRFLNESHLRLRTTYVQSLDRILVCIVVEAARLKLSEKRTFRK